MAAGAAASSRRKKRMEQDRAKRREAVRKKRQARLKRAEKAFGELSDDGAVLPEGRIEDFLSEVVQVPKNKLESEAVELVISSSRVRSRKVNGGAGEFEKSELLGAVEKYGEYVRKSKDIDGMFDRFDANKDGVLSRSELKKALQAHEKKAERNVKGVQAKLLIDDKDIDFILEQSDADNSGAISRSELLPAIAAWEELAAIKIEKRKKGSCTIS
mmetsp:Transcript_1957/g.5176  ORF Transcript_1957/g.5176 Transcript_1957/m.5176 type:complete len:215 (-) Transcript_1957:124-768(-)|eukprot:CAMPEP_0113534338 /NCGR_PEP_ID=MMETSP0015_2-20120614/5106_1 /TAXON_ID=2838 /ORGANISM="Odontella" /LENGTH=214 /DNA_ID=CAMNT_0000433493 /DNA_START=156 /DNA_END=800 /DNA_ORIENTATION=- /assembly_acc=CAM_ASM_000160